MMMCPRRSLVALSLFVIQVVVKDVHAHSHSKAFPMPPPVDLCFWESSCQNVDFTHMMFEVGSKGNYKEQAVGVNLGEAGSIKEEGHANLDGCANEQLSQIMRHVAGPLLADNRMRLGDIAQILQQSVQQATGKSYEIMMGKGDMHIKSCLMSKSGSCKIRIGEYYTSVHETPVQYNINDVQQEHEMSNIDFGERLGGSGYPGQQPFRVRMYTPLEAGQVNFDGQVNMAGQVNLGGCENGQLSQIMQHVAGPLLSDNRMKLGDIAQILQQSVQRATGKSFEIMMGKGDMQIKSNLMSASGSCNVRLYARE